MIIPFGKLFSLGADEEVKSEEQSHDDQADEDSAPAAAEMKAVDVPAPTDDNGAFCCTPIIMR